jgi:hypothetical protein
MGPRLRGDDIFVKRRKRALRGILEVDASRRALILRRTEPFPNHARIRLAGLNNREAPLADPHQVNAIIATAICACRKDHPDSEIHAEEAKQMAKCILEALADAGLQVLPVTAK